MLRYFLPKLLQIRDIIITYYFISILNAKIFYTKVVADKRFYIFQNILFQFLMQDIYTKIVADER